MNRGLWLKSLREVWVATALFAAGVAAFEAVLAAVLPTFHEQLEQQFLQIPFIQNIMRALLGTDVGNRLGPIAVGSIAWVHPVVLSLIWAHETICCTRLPAGEIDRGTVDVLLGLPVSRWSAYVTETAMFLVTGLIILLSGLLGHLLGGRLAPPEYRPDLTDLLAVLANLFCLYIAVGGLAFLVSTLNERRGRAVGTVFALVLISFFIHVLGQFWEPAQSFAFLGLLHYYRPFEILQEQVWPVADMAILSASGIAMWALGGWAFARRDICTV